MNLQQLKQKNPAELINEAEKLGIENVYLLKHGLLSWQEESLPLVK